MVATALSFAQVSTGSAPLSSVEAGPFDSVNLGNLDVQFSVPIIQKAGRGMNFTYALSYDSSVWTPATVNGVKQWQPAFNWGWTAQSVAPTGYLTYSIFHQNCDDLSGHQSTEYRGWSYHDQFGIVHTFGVGMTARLVYDPYNCAFPPGTVNTLVKTATDNSGITLNATLVGQGLGIHTITTKDGTVLNPPLNLTSGYSGSSASVTDANGNQLSVSSTSNSATFTDTLGTTALTVSGTSPVTFTYTSPSGAVHYTLNYVQYTVQTAFSVTGVNEYGRLSNALVDNIQLPDGSKYSFTYEQTPVACTPLPGTYSSYCVTGRIASVTLPAGGKVSYTYSGGTNNRGIYSDGSTAGLTRVLSPATSCASGGCWQYTRSLTTGTIGPASTWTTTITDPPGNQTVVNLAEDSNTTAPTYTLFETQRKVYQGTTTSGTLLSTTINCYNGTTPPATCATTTVGTPVTRTTQYRYLPDASGVEAETDITYDNFGLVHEVDQYNYGHGAVGGILRKTITQYAALGNGIVDRPSSVTIKDANNNTIAYTSYGYDETTPTTTSGTPQHTSVSGSRGLLTSVLAQANSTTNLYRKYTYYDTGTLNASTDVSTSSTTNGATTTYNYGPGSCGNSFVTSITEPLSLSRSMTWDCNGGVMLALTDENGNSSSTAYSGSNYTNVFWRPYSTTDQAGTVTNYFYHLNSSNQPFQTESKSATFNSGNAIIDVLTTTDAFGRSIFHQTLQAPSSSNYDTVATCYDSTGNVSLTTLPYSSAAITTSTDGCPSSNAGNTYAYDALGRTTSKTDSGGGVTSYTYSYSDVLTTVSSPAHSKQLEYDSLGRIGSVCEVTSGTTSWPAASCSQVAGATGYLTQYTYDALGNLTNVTQNAQASSGHQTRSYAYDMLGRLISETNPEMKNSAVTYVYDTLSSDAACGTYTSAGNLLKRLDPAGNASCYSGYDALHRVGTITYPSTSTPAKHFVYDAATVNGTSMTYAKTRLAEAYTCTGTCTSKTTDLGFTYSKTGVTTDLWEMSPHSPTTYYHVTANPWPNGAINTLSGVPGLPTITYSTDGEGRMGTVSATTQNPVTAVSYNPAGQVYALTYGSSDSDSFRFDPNTGRMTGYAFNVGSTPQTVSGSLAWNSNGTLNAFSIIDPLNSANTQACSYNHDNLGRVASVSCGSESSLLNPGFESGNVDWNTGGVWTIVNNAANAQSGSWYLSGTSTTDTSVAANNGSGNKWFAVTPGSIVQYGGWINRVAGSGYIWWSCEVVDSSFNLVAWCPYAGQLNGNGSGWAYYENSYTVPANGAYVQFYAEIHGGSDTDRTSTTAYFDTATFTASGALWGQNFAYDPFGNITKTVPTGANGMTFNVNYDYTNNTNRITTSPYSYTSTSDPNGKTGNMTADASHTYSWDTDGHLTAIDSGSSSGICLVYDALGRAVEKQTGSSCAASYTEILYSPSGTKMALVNGSSLVKAFVPLPAGAQAVYSSSGLQYYRHPDWLGTSRLATTPTRTMYFDGAYAPYGENYSGSGTQDLAFTGQNQDLESSGAAGAGGLYDFLYREQNPVQGRWLSPDPLGLGAVKPADPQTWNRYAYVANRPLSATDSMGLELCGTDLPCESCDDPDVPPEEGCLPFPIPIPDPGPAPDPPSPRPMPQRTGNVWPNNETLGLPGGLNSLPLIFGDVLGLSPGTQCGDFVGCGVLGPLGPLEFMPGATIPWIRIIEIPKWMGRVSGITLILELTLMQTGDNAPHQMSNISENRKFGYAVQEIGRRCGRPLTDDQIRRLHDEITRGGYNTEDIIEIGVAMFCPGD